MERLCSMCTPEVPLPFDAEGVDWDLIVEILDLAETLASEHPLLRTIQMQRDALKEALDAHRKKFEDQF